MRPFLRGELAALYATGAGLPPEPEAWLAPDPHGDVILMRLRTAENEEGALVGLCALDWDRRSARVCAAGPVPAPAVLADALRLLVRYAFDELNLDAVEAEPVLPAAEEPLRALGFRAREGTPVLVRLRDADPPPR